MRLPPFLFCLLTVSAFAQEPAAAPAAAAGSKPTDAADATKSPSRAIVVGQWLANNGDRWEFTAGGAFTLTPAPAASPNVKARHGTYTLTEDRKLKLLSEGREPEIVEYTRHKGTLSLQLPEGNRTLMDTQDIRIMAVLALEDLRMLDAATDQWAIEHNKRAGDHPTFADLQLYLKKGTRLHAALGDPTGPKDVLGNPFSPCVVDQPPKVHPKTAKALSKEAPRKFWEPFID